MTLPKASFCNFCDPQAEGLNQLVVDPQCRERSWHFSACKPQFIASKYGRIIEGGFALHSTMTWLPQCT